MVTIRLVFCLSVVSYRMLIGYNRIAKAAIFAAMLITTIDSIVASRFQDRICIAILAQLLIPCQGASFGRNRCGAIQQPCHLTTLKLFLGEAFYYFL